MSIKIAVCDDDLSVTSHIDAYLKQIQQDARLDFQIFYFSSGEELLAHMPRDVDVLMLDIQMAGVSGIEAARKLRAENETFYLFFITSNVQYALEGYEVHAYAFLRKPVQYALLKTYLLEVARRISGSKPFILELRGSNGVEFVDCGAVTYVEVYGHSATLVFDDGRRADFSVSLNELEGLLRGHSFFRCHKSYLINLNKVSGVRTADIQLSNGDVVPLSKHRKQDFLVAIRDVIG